MPKLKALEKLETKRERSLSDDAYTVFCTTGYISKVEDD